MGQVLSLYQDAPEIEVSGEVCFQNDGEIEINTIRMLGVSVKGEGAIGFFGTGLKYAIAILLRENCAVTIYSGLQKLEFTKQAIKVRDKDFDAVFMNGEQLGFTTELGKTWELWKAYRELYCNCKDEGGIANGNVFNHQPEAGKTKIYIGGLDKIHADNAEFLIKTKPLFVIDGLEIHPRTGEGGIFYKGVKVYQTTRCTAFNYNILTTVDLTEDRTAKYFWDVCSKIQSSILKCAEPVLLEEILSRHEESFEAVSLDYQDSSTIPSNTFIDVVGRLGSNATKKAQITYKKYALSKGIATSYSLSELQKKQLDRALKFVRHLGYVDKYPVIVTDALGEGILGLAENGNIYVSDRCFRLGTKFVAHCLYEEFLHLKHGVDDESRAMQNLLFEQIMTMLEEKLQEAI